MDQINYKRLAIALVVCLALLFLAFAVIANEITIDPTKPDQETVTVTCTLPTLRTDNVTSIALGDFTKVQFWRRVGDTGLWTTAGSTLNTCSMLYDMTILADDRYYYDVTVTINDFITGQELESAGPTLGAIVNVKRAPLYPNAVENVNVSISGPR